MPCSYHRPLRRLEAGRGRLILKAAQTPKQADRAKLYEQAQVIVKEEAPWITLAHSVRFDPLRKEVQGYKMDATAHHYFTNVDLAKQP